jgi:hypothetical protein
MQHDEFARWAASRLEVVADRLEDEDRQTKHGTALIRAYEMRVAAYMVWDMAEAVTRVENPRPFAQALRPGGGSEEPVLRSTVAYAVSDKATIRSAWFDIAYVVENRWTITRSICAG